MKSADTRTPRHAAPQNARKIVSGVGVAAIVLGAGAMAVGISAPAHAATKSLSYACSTQVGAAGTWTAVASVDLPTQVDVGAAIPAPKVNATVTTSTSAADQLRSLNVKTVGGTSAAEYTVGSNARTADLTIPTTNIPSTGPVVTSASGTGTAETAPSAPTTLAVKVGDFTATLTTDSGFILHVTCTLNAGQDTTIGSIQVVDPATSTSTTTSTTTSPTSTSTTTTPPPTSTTTSTTSTTAPPTSTTSTSSSTTAPPTSTTTSSSGSSPATAVVANVVGLRLDEAIAKLSDFEVWAKEAASSASAQQRTSVAQGHAAGASPTSSVDLTKYYVVAQDPTGGTRAVVGSKVLLTVSQTPPSSSTSTSTSTSTSATSTSGPVTPTTVQTGSVAGSSDLGPLVAIGAGMATLGVITLGGGLLVARRRDEV